MISIGAIDGCCIFGVIVADREGSSNILGVIVADMDGISMILGVIVADMEGISGSGGIITSAGAVVGSIGLDVIDADRDGGIEAD